MKNLYLISNAAIFFNVVALTYWVLHLLSFNFKVN